MSEVAENIRAAIRSARIKVKSTNYAELVTESLGPDAWDVDWWTDGRYEAQFIKNLIAAVEHSDEAELGRLLMGPARAYIARCIEAKLDHYPPEAVERWHV